MYAVRWTAISCRSHFFTRRPSPTLLHTPRCLAGITQLSRAWLPFAHTVDNRAMREDLASRTSSWSIRTALSSNGMRNTQAGADSPASGLVAHQAKNHRDTEHTHIWWVNFPGSLRYRLFRLLIFQFSCAALHFFLFYRGWEEGYS